MKVRFSVIRGIYVCGNETFQPWMIPPGKGGQKDEYNDINTSGITICGDSGITNARGGGRDGFTAGFNNACGADRRTAARGERE
jgi:hypothetical protein